MVRTKGGLQTLSPAKAFMQYRMGPNFDQIKTRWLHIHLKHSNVVTPPYFRLKHVPFSVQANRYDACCHRHLCKWKLTGNLFNWLIDLMHFFTCSTNYITKDKIWCIKTKIYTCKMQTNKREHQKVLVQNHIHVLISMVVPCFIWLLLKFWPVGSKFDLIPLKGGKWRPNFTPIVRNCKKALILYIFVPNVCLSTCSNVEVC